MDRQEYREVYLKSEHWRTVRLAALERAEYRCQVCNSPQQLDVHHRTYERLGQEKPADLTVLCRAHHDLFHQKSAVTKSPRAPKTITWESITWSQMAPGDREGLAEDAMRHLERSPRTSKWLANALRMNATTVGSCMVWCRNQGHVRKSKNRWMLTKATPREITAELDEAFDAQMGRAA